MKTTQILMNEHAIIKTYIRKVMNDLPTFSLADSHLAQDGFDFFENYADKFHHSKEENIYFKWMGEKNEMLLEQPLGSLCKEHETCRKALQTAKSALKQQDLATYNKQITSFCETLYDHIEKEDNVLYQMAEEINDVTDDGDPLMGPQFQAVLQEFMAVHNKWGNTPIDLEVLKESQVLAMQESAKGHQCCGRCH